MHHPHERGDASRKPGRREDARPLSLKAPPFADVSFSFSFSFSLGGATVGGTIEGVRVGRPFRRGVLVRKRTEEKPAGICVVLLCRDVFARDVVGIVRIDAAPALQWM